MAPDGIEKLGHQPMATPMASSSGSSWSTSISSAAAVEDLDQPDLVVHLPVPVTDPSRMHRATAELDRVHADRRGDLVDVLSSAQTTCGAVGARIEELGWLFE